MGNMQKKRKPKNNKRRMGKGGRNKKK